MERCTFWRRTFFVLLFAIGALAGCGGGSGDGSNRPTAEPNNPQGPGGPSASLGDALVRPGTIVIPARITAVTIPAGGGQPTVTFAVQDESGNPMTGLTAENLRFTVAKLQKEGSEWRSYINRVETAGAGPGSRLNPRAQARQATWDSGGTLAENGGGSYTYTFGTNLATVVDPATGQPVGFEGDRTHRVAMEIAIKGEGQPTRVANPTFDLVPAGGDPAAPKVAQTASCNECHDLLAVHGGTQVELDACVTCHNPFTTDADSGNSLDLPALIHKIHRGRDLPSVLAGGEFALWSGTTKIDYSDVGYPQDVRYCTKCHWPDPTATPQGDNWRRAPSIAACGSCHDDVVFNPQLQKIPTQRPAFLVDHPGGTTVTDADCSRCHPAARVSSDHAIPGAAAASQFRYNIVKTDYDPATRQVGVTFSVTNPKDGGKPYNIQTHPSFTAKGDASSLAVLIGWSPEEFNNTGGGAATGGSTPAQPIRVNVLSLSNVADNGDGTYTVTRPIPAGVNAVGVAVEGHPATRDEAERWTVPVPVPSAFATLSLTDGSKLSRRQSVSLGKCNVCHNVLAAHEGTSTDNLEACVMCHNADATDIVRRTGLAPSGTPDNKGEEAIDFKTMIHAIHGNEIRTRDLVVFGSDRQPNNFGLRSTTGDRVFYPGILQNCRKCHVEETFQLPLKEGVAATTVDTGTLLADPADDANVTPATAVCFSCHDSSAAVSHMTRNGGQFKMVGAQPAAEGCSSCHGASQPQGVDVVHGLFDVPVPGPEKSP